MSSRVSLGSGILFGVALLLFGAMLGDLGPNLVLSGKLGSQAFLAVALLRAVTRWRECLAARWILVLATAGLVSWAFEAPLEIAAFMVLAVGCTSSSAASGGHAGSRFVPSLLIFGWLRVLESDWVDQAASGWFGSLVDIAIEGPGPVSVANGLIRGAGFYLILAVLSAIDLGSWRRSLFGVPIATLLGCVLVWGAVSYLETSSYVSVERAVAFVSLVAIVALTFARMAGRPGNAPSIPESPQALMAWGLCAAILGASLGFVRYQPIDSEVTGLRIGILPGGYDWDVPEFGRYGSFSSGMLGIFPRILPPSWSLTRIDDVESGELDGLDALLLVNPEKEWSDREKIAIRRFLAGGGGVMVFGDHTDVFGTMGSINSLCSDYGMTLRFDSAYTPSSWRGRARWEAGRFSRQWAKKAPGFGVGASIQVEGGARELLDLRYGFSDVGDYGNVIGSFLGNYAYDEGERIVGLTVAAAADVGDGRIILCGDTSMIQNVSAYGQFRTFTLPMFDYLVQGPRRSAVRWTTIALLVLSMILAVARGGRWRWAIVPVLASYLLPALPDPYVSMPDPPVETVMVDYGSFPDVGHRYVAHNSIGPLWSALFRAGYVPVQGREGDSGDLGDHAAVAIVAPSLPMSSERAKAFLSYLAGGGRVLIVAGGRHAGNLSVIASALGLHTSSESLGPIPPIGHLSGVAQGPSFPSPSALQVDSGMSGVEVLYSWGGLPIAVEVPFGNGRCIWVSDSRFFRSENVEGPSGLVEGNIKFVFEIMKCLMTETVPEETNNARPR